MLEIKEQLHNGTCISVLTGKLNAETVQVFNEWSCSRDDGTVKRIILDLSELTYLSSAGLRAILTTNRNTEKTGTTLLFCGLEGIVKDVFKIAGLLKHLRIYPGVKEALEAE